MEGLLSACYHVCPNYTNFQFGECRPGAAPGAAPSPADRCRPADTSFMYMIAGLCMLKLYQKRHPDINASAYSAYACLAVVIFFSVVGVVSAGARRGRARLGVATSPARCPLLSPPRSSAKGTWPSGSSSPSSTSWPPCCSAPSSTTWGAGSSVRAGWVYLGAWPQAGQGWDGQGLAPGPPALPPGPPALPQGPPALPPLSLQTRASCAGSCTCCTRTASGSAAGPCTW